MFPALIVASVGFLVFLFLVPKPSHVGLKFDDEVLTLIISKKVSKFKIKFREKLVF